jgi:hypothetical protein
MNFSVLLNSVQMGIFSRDSERIDLRSLAIVETREPGRSVARKSPAGVLMANHRVTNRPAASVCVNHQQASQVLTPGLSTARAVADRTDIPARRRLAIVGTHGCACSGGCGAV